MAVRVTPRSDPHTAETARDVSRVRWTRESAIAFICSRQGDTACPIEDQVIRDLAAALAALESERDEWKAAFGVEPLADPEVARAFVSGLAEAASAAEAQATQLKEGLRSLIGACAPPVEALCLVHADAKWLAPETRDGLFRARDELRKSLGVVADGGGGRDE